MPNTNHNTGEPLDADMQLADDPEYAKFCEEQDTPRKPEPGDRVRVTYEAVYRKQHGYGSKHDGDFRVYSDRHDASYRVPDDAEITVIEPARPAVPEEPAEDVVYGGFSGKWYLKLRTGAGCSPAGWIHGYTRASDNEPPQSWEELYSYERGLVRVGGRGPVIGA